MWTFLQLLGAVAVTIGVGMIFVPAGVIVGGVLLVVVGVLGEPT